MENKKCIKCEGIRPITEFRVVKTDKRVNSCRDCEAAYHREYRRNNPDRVRATVRKYKMANKGKISEYHRKRTYGLSEGEYQALLSETGGLCAVCGRDPRLVSKMGPCIDHCHDSGRIRGILCHSCNIGVGMMEDSADTIDLAIAYVSSRVGEQSE